MSQQGDRSIESARAQADAAAAAASVQVRMLRTRGEAVALVESLAEVWRVPVEHPPIDLATVIATIHGHGYVSGAFHDQELVGGSLALLLGERLDTLHSHITGVRDDHARSGVGVALKLQQRVWALEHGLSTVTWTFDPLIGRNARFNLHRLGARLESYLKDFYGPMTDGRNQGQPSDRAYIHWDLRRTVRDRDVVADRQPATALLTMAADGVPEVRTDRLHEAVDRRLSGTIELIIPGDIETIRDADLELALAWRLALRDTLSPLLAAGWRVEGYRGSAAERTGSYLLARPTDDTQQ